MAIMENRTLDQQERSEHNRQLAQMLKGGVIMDVTTLQEAEIAQGCRVPWRSWRWSVYPPTSAGRAASPGWSDPRMIKEIQRAVSIPVMAKARIRPHCRSPHSGGAGNRLYR